MSNSLVDRDVMTVTELIANFSARCHCMDGPPQAFFEMPTDSFTDSGFQIIHRVTYQTVVYRAKGLAECEALLCDKIWEMFDAVLPKERMAILFWRLRPQFETRGSLSQVRLRLAIPGVDLSGLVTPEGSEAPLLS